MYTHHNEPGWGVPGFRPLFNRAGHLPGLAGLTGQRARRGDIRTAILLLLAEQPMHGYQIIGELAERSGGTWSPSAGSVYPTLQMLADEGLVDAEATAGKKVYRLTDAGAEAAAGFADRRAPWDEAADSPVGGSGFHQAAGQLAQALIQVGKSGSAQQLSAAVDVMNDARKKLYAILAQD
jgi:DNA-binding PadR family transcriptional regulator